VNKKDVIEYIINVRV